jgi:(5-formylfuran-3-yl)methyl phosphate synthase
MLLLVSVRSADEVQAALAGGADIIDAKEPARGPLGAVSAATLAEIAGRVPEALPFSVALGDVTTRGEVEAALAATDLPERPGPTFLKLGFAGVGSVELISALLDTAVLMASRRISPPMIIAVAYADADHAGVPSADLISASAHAAGAAGVLIDTYVKDGTGLLEWWSPARLTKWISNARGLGLLTGVAGSLGARDVDRVAIAGPDVIGFRGAACRAGRSGQVCTRRVAQLRRRIDCTGGLRLVDSAHGASGHCEKPDLDGYPA